MEIFEQFGGEPSRKWGRLGSQSPLPASSAGKYLPTN